jgi:hypothetical protein
MAVQSVSFPFSIGDPVRLKAVQHIGGTVSHMTVHGGGAQRVAVRHFDAEGDSVDREFDATDLESQPPVTPPEKPTASVGAPPSAATPAPTPTPKTTVVVATSPAPSAKPAAAAEPAKTPAKP